MKISKTNKIANRFTSLLIIACIIFAMIISSGIFAFAKDGEDEGFRSIGNKTASEPQISAQSAVLYNLDHGETIFSKNGDKRVNPYSATKLMTAYIVLQNLKIDQKITVKNPGARYDETSMKLKKDEVLTVEDLLKGLLVESGNDAARVLAVSVSSSEKKFAELMTKQAKEWGCKNTHFSNASGIKESTHYTTANDFLIIANKTLENKTIKDICYAKMVKIPATNLSEERIYKTHTTLKNTKGSGVLYGKTGYWEDDDCSVALQYRKKDMNLTLVLMGATKKGRPQDAKALLDYAHEVTPGFEVASQKTETGKLWIRGGNKTHIPVCVKNPAYSYPKDGNEENIKLKLKPTKGIKAPFKKGDVIGTLSIYTDGKVSAKKELVSMIDVEKGWFTSNLYISNAAALACLLVFFACVIMTIAFVRARNKRRRRYKARRMRT